MASRRHRVNQWNRTEEFRKYRAGKAYDIRADDSVGVVSVRFGFRAAVLVCDFIFVEELGHFFIHHVSIIGN